MRVREERYGRLFTLEGRLVTPDRRNPTVRTIWMLAFGDEPTPVHHRVSCREASERRRTVSDRISELDLVVLTGDVPDEGVQAGDVGVVLMTHPGHDDVLPGYTIEVMTILGDTVAVFSVPADMVRPVSELDVRHTRPAPLSAASR